MTELTVWTFGDRATARKAARQLRDLDPSGLRVNDAALVEWNPGERSPVAGQLEELAGPSALGAAFWDMIFGLVFVFPRLADATDTSTARPGDALVDGGIDDTFLDHVRKRVVAGTSALWVLGEEDVARALVQGWEPDDRDPIVAALDDQQQRALHRVFPR